MELIEVFHPLSNTQIYVTHAMIFFKLDSYDRKYFHNFRGKQNPSQ